MKEILVAKQLSKTFFSHQPLTILEDISLRVCSGQTIAIIGESGAGKTTLLHLLGTLESLTTGHLIICGIPSQASNWSLLRNQKIGFIFQSYNLLEDYTVLENVLIPAKVGRKDVSVHSTLYQKALHLLEEVKLSHRVFFPARYLSGGEKQRVAIARAFLNDPELILADEPSGNLDHSHSSIIYDLLLSAAHKRNKALIVVTHDKKLASRCQKTYSLANKKLVEDSLFSLNE